VKDSSATDRQIGELSRRDFGRQLAVGAASWGLGGWLSGCENRQPVAPANGSRAKIYRIGLIAKSNSNPVFLAARKGAEVRAAELTQELVTKIEIDWRTPNDEDAQKQADFIEQLVNAGADAIAIACSDASKVSRNLDDAVARGVNVMCFDSDAPESNRLCYVGTDDREAGREVMRHVLARVGDREGTIAILAGNESATNLQRRVEGARSEILGRDKVSLAGVFYHKETPQDSYAKVESVQKANPEIIGWTMVGGWPIMTARPLPWQPGEVVCVSMDTLKPQLEHLRIGDVQLLLGQRYFDFGQRCVEILVEKCRSGKDPEKEIDFAPLDPVTKDNVDEYEKNWEKWA
jgi:ribose transport system substrate-binding protein